eukprot:4654758-Prymnesium_polylepis.1
MGRWHVPFCLPLTTCRGLTSIGTNGSGTRTSCRSALEATLRGRRYRSIFRARDDGRRLNAAAIIAEYWPARPWRALTRAAHRPRLLPGRPILSGPSGAADAEEPAVLCSWGARRRHILR